MDSTFVIRNIDRITKKVEVDFMHDGHTLAHSLFVDTVDSREHILEEVQKHFEQYKQDLIRARGAALPLLNDVNDLIIPRER